MQYDWLNKAVVRTETDDARGVYDPQVYRQGYTAIRANWEQNTFPFVDMLYDISNPIGIQAALSTEDFCILRHTVLAVCQREIITLFQTDSKDPLLRQRLAEYYHAIQLLGPPSENDPYAERMIYILLCVALDRHREARDLARKLLSQRPHNDTVQSLLEYAEDHMSLPRFHTAFITRGRNAWKAASQQILQYRRGKIDQEQLEQLVRKLFHIWLGMSADVEVTSRREGNVAFTSNNWPLDFYAVRASIYAGLPEQPDSLQGYWGASIGAGTRYETVSLKDGTALDLSTVQTAVEDNVAHSGVRVKVYHDAISPVAAYSDVQQLFSRVVEHILGAPDYCVNVRAVETMRMVPRHVTGTLDTLPEQLAALGYTSGHSTEDVASIRWRRTYTRRPKAGPIQRLRDDIRTGDTLCWALQEDYEHNRTDAADHYMERSIAPVFLAWPRSIMDCAEEAFTQKLVDALSQGDIQCNVQVLGRASGTQYCYLDLLAWSTLHLVDAVEKFFAKIPKGDAVRIQSFYYDAYPCPVTMARTEEHCAIRHLDTAFMDTDANRSAPAARSSAPQKPKEKKKNAAKAKRKHQKRRR